jgi:hypothetical protein
MDFIMNDQELLKLVKQHYIFDASLSKAGLIRNIQIMEGNQDCYATNGRGECDESECSWREDCQLDSTAFSKG